MKRISAFAIALISSVCFLISCGKDDNKTHCQFMAPDFVLVDYTENERDTIIIRRFEKDNSFSTIVDSTMLSKGELKYTVVGQDSIVLTSTKEGFRKFHEELHANDWEIYIPATGTLRRISEVKGMFESKRDNGEECRSFVESMKYEGSTRIYTTWFGDSYRFFVTNP